MSNSKSLTFLQQHTGELIRNKASETSFPVQSDLCTTNTPVKTIIFILFIFYTKQEKMTCYYQEYFKRDPDLQITAVADNPPVICHLTDGTATDRG